LTVVELGPNAHLELLRPEDRRPGFSLVRGLLHLFHRDKPGEYYFRTPTASPVIRGTEFNLAVAEDGATTLHLLEGEVALTNDFGALDLKSAMRRSSSPRATRAGRGPDAVNVIQWCLYYPAVLDQMNAPQCRRTNAPRRIARRVSSRRLARALANIPRHASRFRSRKVYLAELLLAVGEVSEAEVLMQSLGGTDERALQLAMALRTLIAAVKFQPRPERLGRTKRSPPLS